jgi:hypothetical protein
MFQSHSLNFLDTKKNMVIDGFFTKIIYSDATVSLNGLYLHCPLESVSIPNFPIASSNSQHRFAGVSNPHTRNQIVSSYQENGRTIVTKKIPFMFSLTNPNNIHFIKELNRIEHEIIEFYKDFFKINKVNVYSLRNQLKSGNIRVIQRIEYATERKISESDHINNVQIPVERSPEMMKSLVIKISGVWENEMNVGVTFKFQM